MNELEQAADIISRHREIAVLAALELRPDSTIVVAGAYKGDTIAFLTKIYPDANIFGFEPQEWAYKICLYRFEHNFRVSVFNYGLGIKAGMFPMGEFGNDACSFVPDPAARTQGLGEMRKIDDVFNGLKILQKDIDLILFNVEGYEYELIPYMKDKKLLERVRLLVVQLHDLDRSRVEQLELMLSLSHQKVWSFGSWPHWDWQQWIQR